MDHYEDRFLLIPAFPAWQTTRLSSNPSSTPSAQGRSEEPEVGGGGVVSHLPTTFQSLINIHFPKIVGERGAGEVKNLPVP